MNIKVNPPPHIRESIEKRIKGLKKAIVRVREEAKHEEKRILKQIEAETKFWAENEKPIYDWKIRRKVDISRAHETKTVWIDFGDIYDHLGPGNRRTGWACKYCKQETEKKYVCCGDSRYDESFDVCDCDGAAKNGRPYKDLN